jgi:hypothetical protein
MRNAARFICDTIRATRHLELTGGLTVTGSIYFGHSNKDLTVTLSGIQNAFGVQPILPIETYFFKCLSAKSTTSCYRVSWLRCAQLYRRRHLYWTISGLFCRLFSERQNSCIGTGSP